ncbi:EF-hand calcium-binding domain-containing protein 6 isoform X2 [Callorhinchus milii]|uniref:EF-hand calcium-binding domain-containing protein 6 isoform X2 n=1 Tax=Callorhinchus milii TaxID=7868 RepID=UPI001C3FC846|nr:EF-hand calcium-binding domain-containing protein 6 isoform X2 [Callorhinchus milii]
MCAAMAANSEPQPGLCLMGHGMPMSLRPQSAFARTPSRKSSREMLRPTSSLGMTYAHDFKQSFTKFEQDLGQKVRERNSELRRIFCAYDLNKKLAVTKSDFRRVIEDFLLPLNWRQFNTLLAKLPINRDGTVPYIKFLDQLSSCDSNPPHDGKDSTPNPHLTLTQFESRLKEKMATNLKNIIRTFRLFDYNRDQSIKRYSVRKVLESFCFTMTDAQFNWICPRSTSHSGGKQTVNYQEFLEKMGFAFDPPCKPPLEGVGEVLNWEIPLQEQKQQLDTCEAFIQEEKANMKGLTINELETQFRKKMRSDCKYLSQAFLSFDSTRTGFIPLEDFKSILSSFVFPMNHQIFHTLMTKFDVKTTGKIEWQQFLAKFEDPANTYKTSLATSPARRNTPVGGSGGNLVNASSVLQELRKNFREQQPGLRRVLEVSESVEEMLRDKITGNWKAVHQALRDVDSKATGLMSFENLRGVLHTHCLPISDQHLQKLCQQFQISETQIPYKVFLDKLGVKVSVSEPSPPSPEAEHGPSRGASRQAPGPPQLANKEFRPSKTMSVNEAITELWSRITNNDVIIRKSFLSNQKQCNSKINRERFRKLLKGCGIIMTDEQFTILADRLGFKNGDMNFCEFSGLFEDRRANNPGAVLKRMGQTDQNTCNLRYMSAEECIQHVMNELRKNYLDLPSVFYKFDSDHDGLITMQDLRAFLDSYMLLLTNKEYRRFLEMIGLAPDALLTYTDFLTVFDVKAKPRKGNASVSLMQDVQSTFLACEQAHNYLASKAQTRMHDLIKNFKVYDCEGNLIVRKKDLRDVLYRFFLPISPKQFEKLWSWYDPFGKGFLSHSDFVKKLDVEFASQPPEFNDQTNLVQNVEKPQKVQSSGLDVGKLERQLKEKFREHYADFSMAFAKLDKNKDGYIGVSDLLRVLLEHGYQLDEEQLKELFFRFGITIHNNRISACAFLRAIDDSTAISQYPAMIPENLQSLPPEKVMTKLKEVVTASYDSWYEASEAWEEKLGTPKLAPHVTIDDILTRVREVVTSRLHVINREFAEIDYANLKVVSKQHFKEIFCKYFMHLTEEQFENLWNLLPLNDFGNLEYHKFLKQFTSEKPAGAEPRSPGKPGSSSHAEAATSRPRTIAGKVEEGFPRPGSSTSSQTTLRNCETIEQKLRKHMYMFWKEIEKECKHKDSERQGQIDIADFLEIMEKFCIKIKPDEMQCLIDKYQVHSNGRFGYTDFLHHFVLMLKPQETSLLHRVKIPQPKIPLNPGVQHLIFTHFMMRIQARVTECWKLMRRTFKNYDDDACGCISLHSFKQVLQQYGIFMSEEEYYHLSTYYDKDLKGIISYNEFLRAFLR